MKIISNFLNTFFHILVPTDTEFRHIYFVLFEDVLSCYETEANYNLGSNIITTINIVNTVVHMDYAAFTAEGDITDPSHPDAKIFEISLTVVVGSPRGHGSCTTEVYLLRTQTHFEAVNWVASLNTAKNSK